MEKNLQADSSLCLPHWLQRQSKNRFQLRLSCGKGRHVEDRRYQQRQIGGMIGLLRRKLGAWRSKTSEESLYAGATSGILREEWQNSIFPYSCVWAKDAEYGVGRVDWVKLLCTNKSGNGPCREVFENNLDRVPDGVADITRAKDQGKQLQAVQTHDNGSGENQEPPCAGGQQGDCEKILQDSGNEICGSICGKQNCSGAGTEGEHACLDFAGAEKFCHVGFDFATFLAEASCHDCCLASPCPCFGFPAVQDRYSAEACDSCSIELSDCSQQECATAIALPLCQASSSHAGSCTAGNFRGCSLNAFLSRFGVPRPQGDDFPLDCVKGDFACDVHGASQAQLQVVTQNSTDKSMAKRTESELQGQLTASVTSSAERTQRNEDGRSAQVICHFDLEHDDEHAVGPRDTSPLHDPPRVVQQGYLDGSAIEDAQGDASTGFHLLQGPSAVRVLSSADHVRCTEDDRILQVICHFDLEHDDEQAVGSRVSKPWHAPPKVVQQGHQAGSAVEDGHVWCTCPLKLQQGHSVLCHCSQVGASIGFHPCNLQEGCQCLIKCHFDLEHGDGTVLGCPYPGCGPQPQRECDVCCCDLSHYSVPHLQLGFLSRDQCEPHVANSICQCTCSLSHEQRHRKGRTAQVTCQFDLEHDDHDWYICPAEGQQGGKLRSHGGSQASDVHGDVQCIFQERFHEQLTCHFDLEHGDGLLRSLERGRGAWEMTGVETRSFSFTAELVCPCLRTLGFRPLTRCLSCALCDSPLPAGLRSLDLKGSVDTVQQELLDPSCPSIEPARPTWTWMPKCLLGVMQWMCVPSRIVTHCYLLATRVGEASNPGPEPVHTAGAPAFDISNLLGPQFATMLQSFIQQQIQNAVQAAVQEAMRSFQSGSQAPVCEERVSREGPQPKRRRKGKGEGSSKSEEKPAASAQPVEGPKAKGKGKAAGRPEDPKNNQQGGRGGHNPPPQTGKDGKGVGGKAQTTSPQPKAENQDGWTKVGRKRDDHKDAQFELRQQDWNAPLVSFAGLAKRLQDTKDDEVCRGVILCPRKEIETARALFAGTPKKFAFLLIVLSKEYSEKPQGMQPQKVPGKCGTLLRAQDAYLQQAVSPGQAAPQPTGISSTPQKVATKATAVLCVKIPKAFAEGTVWKNFVEKPQRHIAQWTAARHVLCIDCFNWAEEQIQGSRRQVHGVIRVAQADVTTLLAHSGEQGIFLQQPRDQVRGQHIEWAERVSKSESDADYLTRVNRARGDLGLVCRDLSLGWRRPNDASTPVRKVWMLEHAPRMWDLQQVAGLLQEQFTDINMFRQIHRGSWKNFIFRAACKRGSDVDLVPVTVILDEPGGGNAPITLWAKLAPPKHVEFKQRQIRGGAVPYFDKPNVFDPVAVASAAPKAEPDTEGKDCKGDPPPVPKRTCSAKRPVPEGTVLQKQPADGDCLFHTFSAGLHALRKEKDGEPIHPHELRARTVAHIRRYAERYKPQWEADGKLGPTGKAVDSWEDFLEAISKTGAYAGDAELKALCRIYDTRVVLVPEAPQFPVCVFHRKASTKRTMVIYHTHHHFDYLAPAGKAYPDEITQVSADPSGGFLVGGKSSRCTAFTNSSRFESVKTTWTSQDGKPAISRSQQLTSGPKADKQISQASRKLSRSSQSDKGRASKGKGGSGSCQSAYCASRFTTTAATIQASPALGDGSTAKKGQPNASPETSRSGLGLGTSPLVSPPPPHFPSAPKDRDSFLSSGKFKTGARKSAAGTIWTDPTEQEETSSQDLEGCEPGRRVAAPCSHRQATELPEDRIFRCQHCPYQKKVASLAQVRHLAHFEAVHQQDSVCPNET